jgi:hypothetical protein
MAMAMAPAQQATVPNASIDTKHEDMIVSGLKPRVRRGAPAPRVRAGAVRLGIRPAFFSVLSFPPGCVRVVLRLPRCASAP